jgi:hypothetical protein
MGKMSREKGKAGEREVFGLLSDLLGFVVKRNINARRGDCDSLEIPGWAPEVKRVERWEEIYWAQAVDQAERLGRKPVLFYRGSRRPWVAMLDLADVAPGIRRGHRVEISLEAFADLVREQRAATDLMGGVTVDVAPGLQLKQFNGHPVVR